MQMAWTPDGYYFSKLKRTDIREVLEFYVTEIYEHYHYTDYTQESYQDEIEYLLKEDHLYFDNSVYYVIRDYAEHKIWGSIKTTYWDKKIQLPIEELFNVHPRDFMLPGIENFWHLGRFGISSKIPRDRIGILKKMLFNAFYPIHEMHPGLIIAECDKKVTLTLEKMHIPSFSLGKSIEYICSETIPIYIKSEWLDIFITSNADRYFSDESLNDIAFFRKKQPLLNEIGVALFEQ